MQGEWSQSESNRHLRVADATSSPLDDDPMKYPLMELNHHFRPVMPASRPLDQAGVTIATEDHWKREAREGGQAVTTARERDLMEIVHSWRIAAMTAEMLGDHSRSGTLGECANDLETALLARPPETREEGDAPPCWRAAAARGDECRFCTGEACGTCGAGLHSVSSECEHDVIRRHEGAFYTGPDTAPPAPPEKPRLPVRTRNHLTGEALKTAMERANPRPSLEDLDVPSEEPERCPHGCRNIDDPDSDYHGCSCEGACLACHPWPPAPR